MKLTETFSLAREGGRLHVGVKFESSHLPRPLTLERVYDDTSTRERSPVSLTTTR